MEPKILRLVKILKASSIPRSLTIFLFLLLVTFILVDFFRTLENVGVSKCKVLYYTFSCRINLT